MKKILLFGSQGMLGSEFFEMYGEEFEIIPLAHFHVDFVRPEEIPERINEFSPDLIINAAAWTNVDKAEEERYQKDVFTINAKSVEVIAKICEEKKIPFYHISTDFVFSGEKDDIFEEKDTPNPCNIYGKSKLEGEKLALKYNQTRIIRTAWLTGKNSHNFVQQMIHLARTQDSLRAINDQFGSPSFCEDVSKSLYEIVKNPLKYPIGIYHAINEGIASRYDIVKKLLEILGIEKELTPVGHETFPALAKRPMSSILKNTLLPPLQKWEDALAKYLEGEKKKLEKEREIERKK